MMFNRWIHIVRVKTLLEKSRKIAEITRKYYYY